MRLEKLGPVGPDYVECGSRAPAFEVEELAAMARVKFTRVQFQEVLSCVLVAVSAYRESRE